jgi:RNA polymerase sigma factor (sigma-70 family)
MLPGNAMQGLAERIRMGERSAEESLVDHFYPRVYAIAVVRIRDRESARDLAQEIMLAVLCALRDGKLRDQSGLAGYVCATARNRVSQFLRTRSVKRSADSQPEPVLDRFDPEKSLENAERRRLALSAIKRLSAADRKILRLTLVEGLKPKEIAARLGLKPEVVRKRRSRAVRRAREAIRTMGVTKSMAERLIPEEPL